MPADLAAKVLTIGGIINPAATASLYVPLHGKEPYAGIKVARDLKYGPSERNLLDVFASEATTSQAKSVLLLLHGRG